MKKLALVAFILLASCTQLKGAVGMDTNPSGDGKTANTGGTTTQPAATNNNGGTTTEPVAARPDPPPPAPTGGRDAEGDDLIVVAPAPGVEVIKPLAAPWCDLAKSKSYSTGAMARAIQRALKDGWNAAITFEVGEAVCVNPGAPGYMKNTAAAVQAWVNATGQTRAEAIESIRARMDKDAWDKGQQETCAAQGVTREASEDDRAFAAARQRFFGCNYDKIPQWRENNTDTIRGYLEFAGLPTDPILHVYEVRQCLHDFDGTWQPDYNDLFRWIVCSPVAARLDKAAFDRHVAGAKLNTYGRTIARESFAAAKMLHARYASIAKDLIAREAALKTILDAAETAWVKWEKLAAEHKASVDAALAYHKLFFGPSKSARKGCFENLRKLWAPMIAKAKPADLKAARELINGAVYDLLTTELMLCGGADGQSLFGNLLLKERGYSRHVRGPRTAAYFAALDAVSDVLADREKFPMRPNAYLGYNDDPISAALSYAREKDNFGSDAESVIDKLQTTGDDVKITFIKVKIMVDELSCKQTNRIAYINASGIVEYQSDCRPVGKKEVTLQEEPIIIPAWAAGGLKKGNLASFYINGPERRGFPVAVWADKEKKALVNYLGVELK